MRKGGWSEDLFRKYYGSFLLVVTALSVMVFIGQLG